MNTNKIFSILIVGLIFVSCSTLKNLGDSAKALVEAPAQTTSASPSAVAETKVAPDMLGCVIPFENEATKTIYLPQGASWQEDVYDGLFWVRNKDRNYGFYNVHGEQVIDFLFFKVSNFTDGVCVVQTAHSENAILYKDGTLIELPKEYKRVSDFVDGVALAFTGEKVYFINKKGEVVYPNLMRTYNTFSPPRPLREGLRAFYDATEKKYGYINEAGEIIIKPAFYEAGPFSEGVAIVQTGNDGVGNYTWGIIDNKGKVVFNGFETANKPTDFSSGMSMVTEWMGNGVWHYFYVDKAGRKVSPNYRKASAFADGYAFVETQESYDLKQMIVINRELNPIKTIPFYQRNEEPDFTYGLASIYFPPISTHRVMTPNGQFVLSPEGTRGKFGVFHDPNYTYASLVNAKNQWFDCIVNTKGEIVLIVKKA